MFEVVFPCSGRRVHYENAHFGSVSPAKILSITGREPPCNTALAFPVFMAASERTGGSGNECSSLHRNVTHSWSKGAKGCESPTHRSGRRTFEQNCSPQVRCPVDCVCSAISIQIRPGFGRPDRPQQYKGHFFTRARQITMHNRNVEVSVFHMTEVQWTMVCFAKAFLSYDSCRLLRQYFAPEEAPKRFRLVAFRFDQSFTSAKQGITEQFLFQNDNTYNHVTSPQRDIS